MVPFRSSIQAGCVGKVEALPGWTRGRNYGSKPRIVVWHLHVCRLYYGDMAGGASPLPPMAILLAWLGELTRIRIPVDDADLFPSLVADGSSALRVETEGGSHGSLRQNGPTPRKFGIPAGIERPNSFRPDRARLSFRGYMSKTDFDRLSQLSTDWNFRRSLEELFRLSIPEEPSRARGVGRFLAAVTRMFTLG